MHKGVSRGITAVLLTALALSLASCGGSKEGTGHCRTSFIGSARVPIITGSVFRGGKGMHRGVYAVVLMLCFAVSGCGSRVTSALTEQMKMQLAAGENTADDEPAQEQHSGFVYEDEAGEIIAEAEYGDVITSEENASDDTAVEEDEYILNDDHEEKSESVEYLRIDRFDYFSSLPFVNGKTMVKTGTLWGHNWNNLSCNYYIIDDNGIIADLGNLSDGDGPFRDDIDADFEDGLFYCKSAVFDGNGDIVFQAGENQEILCVADGLIAIYEKPMGFTASEAKFGIVGLDGEWYIPLQYDPNIVDSKNSNRLRFGTESVVYLGEGCFAGPYYKGYVVINAYDNFAVFTDERENARIGAVKDGRFFCGEHIYSTTECDPIEIEDPMDAYIEPFLSAIICGARGHVYNYDGEMIADLSGRQARFYSVDRDHVIAEAKGDDGNSYFMMIDSDGNMPFEPKLITDYVQAGTPSNRERTLFAFDGRIYDYDGNLVFDAYEKSGGTLEGIRGIDGNIISWYTEALSYDDKECVYMYINGNSWAPQLPNRQYE